MKTNGVVSPEILKESSNIKHGLAETALGIAAMTGAIVVNQLQIADRLDKALIVGGLLVALDGSRQMLGAGHALDQLHNERTTHAPNDSES